MYLVVKERLYPERLDGVRMIICDWLGCVNHFSGSRANAGVLFSTTGTTEMQKIKIELSFYLRCDRGVVVVELSGWLLILLVGGMMVWS